MKTIYFKLFSTSRSVGKCSSSQGAEKWMICSLENVNERGCEGITSQFSLSGDKICMRSTDLSYTNEEAQGRQLPY